MSEIEREKPEKRERERERERELGKEGHQRKRANNDKRSLLKFRRRLWQGKPERKFEERKCEGGKERGRWPLGSHLLAI